ncbi:hypothetical protein ISCGN_002802 [Ixodes scapularis]
MQATAMMANVPLLFIVQLLVLSHDANAPLSSDMLGDDYYNTGQHLPPPLLFESTAPWSSTASYLPSKASFQDLSTSGHGMQATAMMANVPLLFIVQLLVLSHDANAPLSSDMLGDDYYNTGQHLPPPLLFESTAPWSPTASYLPSKASFHDLSTSGHGMQATAMMANVPLLFIVQDVLLQIKEDILDRISCTTTRAVLALDIKGAFDNVSHTLVFENLASTGCGPRMYDYVRDFLSNWMATIGIESIRTSTIPIPSKGNRQGSVLSPTFGRQDFLEEVIETVQNYLEAGNLQRAPDKSQLLLLRAGKPIPEEEEGGHPPHRDGGAKYTVDRLVKTTTQVMRMVRRITSHRHGLEESDLIRLTQPLVVSHIACANPYLNLLSRGKGKMDVIIRKGY